MKTSVRILLLFIAAMPMLSMAELTKKGMTVNVRTGTVNDVKPTASQQEIKKAIKGWTGDSDEADSVMNCGGGVFYVNDDVYFYTGRDYIEVRSGFKGTCDVQLLNMRKENADELFGAPVREEKDWMGNEIYYYRTDYGCLMITLDAGTIVQFSMHYKSAGQVVNCNGISVGK